MEIFASYDLTRCAWSATQLVGCDPKPVQRYVDLRDAGLDPFRRTRRARLIDPHLEKVEELVEDSHGKIGLWETLVDRHLERVADQVRPHVVGHRPAHHSP